MNPNEAIRTTAILQDAVNDVHDPMPGGTSMWARTGDEIWTASVAPTSGYDPSGLAYETGDLVVRRNVADGDRTRITGGFLALPDTNKNPMDALVEGIVQWSNGANPDETGTVTNPGRERLAVPQTGELLTTGWSEALAQAETVAANNITDIALLRASLLQAALDQTDKPTVWFLDENQYDLITVSWHTTSDNLYDGFAFTHWQVDEFDDTVKTIAHSEPTPQPARAMTDEQLAADSRNIADNYQSMRFHDGGDVSRGMNWTVARTGILRENEKPLLLLADGRTAPEWNRLVDEAATDIASGKVNPPEPEQAREEEPAAQSQAEQTPAIADRPNVWVANRLAHPYTRRSRDGREWKKMIVTMPIGTVVNGQDLGGWALDRFMSPANEQRKQDGRGINVWFTPGQPVELFQGRGGQRRSVTIDDPRKLVSAIIQAEKLAKERREQAKDLGDSLAAMTVEEHWPQVNRLQTRLHEYAAKDAYDPDAALRAARRVIDRAAVAYERTHGNPQCANVRDSRFTPEQRQQAAQMLLDNIMDTGQPTHEQTAPTPEQAQIKQDKNRIGRDEETNRGIPKDEKPAPRRRRHHAR